MAQTQRKKTLTKPGVKMINYNKCKVLGSKEQDKVARLAVKGDKDAIEQLITSNIKLVSKIANKYKSFGQSVDDLVSEGLIGLIESIPRFEPDRGTQFTTYAGWYIRKNILDFIRDNFRIIKLGTTQNQRKLFWRLNREIRALQQNGIEVNEFTIADRLQVKPQEVKDMQIRMAQSEQSIQAVNPSTGLTLEESTDSGTVDPEEYSTFSRMNTWVQNKMITFEQKLKEKELVIWNYLVASEDPWAMTAIADKLHCSRQYVDQVEKRLIERFIKYARASL